MNIKHVKHMMILSVIILRTNALPNVDWGRGRAE